MLVPSELSLPCLADILELTGSCEDRATHRQADWKQGTHVWVPNLAVAMIVGLIRACDSIPFAIAKSAAFMASCSGQAQLMISYVAVFTAD